MVVMTLPISTTNITGLPIMLRGFSLSSELQAALRTKFKSQIDLWWLAMGSLESLSNVHQKMFKNRPQTQGRKERQSAQNQNDADQQQSEQRRRDWKCA